jgi:glycosyltransferase involved in cell wall biosynthesis
MKKAGGGLRRVGLIGPVLPHRGGIAQHTTMLHRALRTRADLLTVSFKKLYPKWMYPGKTLLDTGHKGHEEDGVQYALDPLNPVTWKKVSRLFIKHSTEAVIIPWWTVFCTPCYLSICSCLRQKNIKVLFLCHNVVEHEKAAWKRMASKLVLSQGSRFFVHYEAEAARLKALIPKADISVDSHPIYHQFPIPRTKPGRRAKLELLFFGLVRPYKGLDVLIEAMHQLKNEDIFLTIAGEWWYKNEALKNRIEAMKDKIEVVDRYVTEEEAAAFFSRADLIVLPYRHATGSGVIPVAYHYGKPVIATTVGGLPEVVVDGVSGRLVKPEDPDALARVLQEFLQKDPASMHEGVKKTAAVMTWEGLAECILNVIEQESSL